MCEITVATINLAFPRVPMLDFPHKKLNSFPSFLWGGEEAGFNQEKPQCAQSSHHQHCTDSTWPPVASLKLQDLQDTAAVPQKEQDAVSRLFAVVHPQPGLSAAANLLFLKPKAFLKGRIMPVGFPQAFQTLLSTAKWKMAGFEDG